MEAYKSIKNKISFIFPYFIAFAIIFFLAKTLFLDTVSVDYLAFDYNLSALFFAFIFGALNIISLFYIWIYMLRKIDPAVKTGKEILFEIFINSWFGRYIPGKVWTATGKIYMGAKNGLDKKPLALASFFELSLSTITHIFLSFSFGIFLLPAALPGSFYVIISALIIFIIVFFIVIHPKIFLPTLSFFLNKLKGGDIISSTLAYRCIIFVTILYAVPIIFSALSFLFISKMFIDSSLMLSLQIIGIFILASFVAKIIFFIPAGIGAREGILMALLIPYVPFGIAMASSLVSRVWFTLIDILIIGIFYIIRIYIKKYA